MVNYNVRDLSFISIGIIGALSKLYGIAQPYPQPWYVLGAFLLLLTAIHFKLIFYIGLETILLAGHFSIMLGLHERIQIALPILLSLQLAVYYLLAGRLKNPWLWFGLTGIILLSLAFHYPQQWILFSGCVCISSYAFYRSVNTERISLLWAILNSLFAIQAILKASLQYLDIIF
ncbi:MAG: hypothetical protein JJT82_07965 [Legionellaceae bacterium]|nr:hypothetical protein [Legionellaceae bacterium]